MHGNISRRTVAGILVSFALAVSGVALTVQPASAATPDGYTRPASPGAGYKWGVSPAHLCHPNAWSDACLWPNRGGWQGGGNWVVAEGDTTTFPQAVEIGEPFVGSGGKLELVAKRSNSKPTPSFPQGPTWSFGSADGTNGPAPGTTAVTYVACQTSEWSLTTTLMPANGRTISSGYDASANPAGVYVRSGGGQYDYRRTPSSCPYIVAIALDITYIGCDTLDNHSSSCSTRDVNFLWTAEGWYSGSNSYFNTDPLVRACMINPAYSADCPFIVGSRAGLDGTDFATVCGGAPAMTFGDWNWLPATIGHYARCLFVPVNGFDRLGWVSSAWDASPASSVATAAEEAANSLDWGEGCGTLVDLPSVTGPGGSTIVPAINISTCSWTWAAPVHDFLKIAFMALGGLGLVVFVAKTITGVVNRRTPQPVGDDGDAS